MSKMQVPGRIKAARFRTKFEHPSENNKIMGLEYLIQNLKCVVSSEKYVLNPKVLVLDTKVECDKIKLKKAIESVTGENNKVVKINSSNRHSIPKSFKQRKGFTSPFKRMCVTMQNTFDLGLLFGGANVNN